MPCDASRSSSKENKRWTSIVHILCMYTVLVNDRDFTTLPKRRYKTKSGCQHDQRERDKTRGGASKIFITPPTEPLQNFITNEAYIYLCFLEKTCWGNIHIDAARQSVIRPSRTTSLLTRFETRDITLWILSIYIISSCQRAINSEDVDRLKCQSLLLADKIPIAYYLSACLSVPIRTQHTDRVCVEIYPVSALIL